MLRLFLVIRPVVTGRFMLRSGVLATGRMMLVKLLGAVRPVKFMAFAGNSEEQGNSHQKDRE